MVDFGDQYVTTCGNIMACNFFGSQHVGANNHMFVLNELDMFSSFFRFFLVVCFTNVASIEDTEIGGNMLAANLLFRNSDVVLAACVFCKLYVLFFDFISFFRYAVLESLPARTPLHDISMNKMEDHTDITRIAKALAPDDFILFEVIGRFSPSIEFNLWSNGRPLLSVDISMPPVLLALVLPFGTETKQSLIINAVVTVFIGFDGISSRSINEVVLVIVIEARNEISEFLVWQWGLLDKEADNCIHGLSNELAEIYLADGSVAELE